MNRIKRHILHCLRQEGRPLSLCDIFRSPTELHYEALRELNRQDKIEVVGQGKYQLK